MPTQQCTHRGFTILEVTIVLGIALVMTAAMIPNISASLQNYRLYSTAQEIASQIQLARMRALRDNRMATFLVTASGRQFGIDTTADGNLTSGSGDVVMNLDNGVSFAALTSPPVTGAVLLSSGTKSGIGFTPRGTLTAITTSGTPDYNPANLAAAGYAVYLSNTQNHFAAVTVSPMGRVRTWTSGSGTSWKSGL
jgi:Tfp pilus assembly protein FimT